MRLFRPPNLAVSAWSLRSSSLGHNHHRTTMTAATFPPFRVASSVRNSDQNANTISNRQYSSSSSTTALQPSMVNTLESAFDWSDRIGLQHRYTLEEKGWQVSVDWRPTPYGAGLFSKQDIAKGTILRTGILGVNLKQFTSSADIEEFCQFDPTSANDRRNYVKDYLWGFSHFADGGGYPLDAEADIADRTGRRRFYGMWIPGNGLNHSTKPNTVYVASPKGIDLVALTDISVDDELFDDYRRHGMAPTWLKEFAKLHNVTLNFADCNDFVKGE